jgi:hypothetical protein
MAVAILLAGCAGTGTWAQANPSPAPSATPKPTPTEVGTLTLTESFDEMGAQLRRGCTLDAAGSPISAGAVMVSAVNDSDRRALAEVWRIGDGRTYEELEAYVEGEQRLVAAAGSGNGNPAWLSDLISLTLEPGQSASQVAMVPSGTHAAACIWLDETDNPVWMSLAGPLEAD